MATPWLSVAMTTYNARDYLATALDSVLAQQDDGVEVIAVDDASTDETLAILESYRSRLDLRVVTRERNTANGMAGMNDGLRRARGDYVCFLHHDDYWLDGRLRAALAREPDAVLLLHAARFVDHNGARLGQWNCPLPANRCLAPEEVVERLLVQNFVPVQAPIFRRDAALRVGGLEEALWYSADWDFWLKLAASGRTIYLADALSAYRIHNHSMTWWRTDEQSAEQRRQLEQVLDRHSGVLDSLRPMRPAVRRAARFSVEVNTTLAAYAHQPNVALIGLATRFLGLGPLAWHRYLRDSRIIERVTARLHAGMHRWHLAAHSGAIAPNSPESLRT
jgi:GT2 family glycosyltransferase